MAKHQLAKTRFAVFLRHTLAAFLIALLPSLPLMSHAESLGTSAQVSIQGMTCAACAESVTRALKKVPGIDSASVHVSLSAKQATLRMTSQNPETISAVRRAITEAGYSVTTFQTLDAKGQADGIKR
jgi:copper chaperone CopZ